MTVELNHDSPVSLWNGPNCNKSYLNGFPLRRPADHHTKSLHESRWEGEHGYNQLKLIN